MSMHEDYNTQLRRSAFLSKEALRSTKLPILSDRGHIYIPNSYSLAKKRVRGDAGKELSEDYCKKVRKGTPKKSDKQKHTNSSSNAEWKKLNTILAQKNYLSQISQTILSDPNKNLNLLDLLFDLYKYSHGVQHNQKELSRLTLVSIASIIIDLTPSYNLNDDNTAGNTTQSSKSTIAIRNYEASLLKHTLHLIEILNHLYRKNAQLAIPIICRLITTGNETSYSEQLIELCLWSFSDLYETHPNLAKQCSECLQNLIHADPTLRSTLRIVKLISKLDKAIRKKEENNRKYFFGSILIIFSKLDIKITKIWNQHRDLAPQSKRLKKDKELIKDLRTSSLIDTYQTTKKHESEILQELLVLYLRILNDCYLYHDETLNICMRGIGSISILVNITLTDEIIDCIKKLLSSGRKFHPIVQLGGIETIMNVLKSSHGEIQMEVSWLVDLFYDTFISALPYLAAYCGKTTKSESSDNTSIERLRDTDWNNFQNHYFSCLDNYIKYNLSSSTHSDNILNYSRMVKLIKKLLEISLHTEFDLCSAICKEVNKLLSKNPGIVSFLQLDSLTNNTSSNQVSVIPEISLLINHIYPHIRTYIISILEKSEGDFALSTLPKLLNHFQKHISSDKQENSINLITNKESNFSHNLGEDLLRSLWPEASHQAFEKFLLKGSILKPKSLNRFRSTCTNPQNLTAWKNKISQHNLLSTI